MSSLTYLLLLLIMVIVTIAIIVFYLALKSKTFDWSWVEYPWQGEYMEAPWFYQWAGEPYARARTAGLEKGASPKEYAKHHRRKERDMR